MSLTAPVKWAQRTDSLYVTISLPDVKDEKLNLEEDKLTFSGKSNGSDYAVELKFFKSVDIEGSIMNVLPSSIQMKIMKKDKEEEQDHNDSDNKSEIEEEKDTDIVDVRRKMERRTSGFERGAQ